MIAERTRQELAADAPRRYVVGTYCPRGGGHFDLIGSEDYDGSCGSKGWPLFIEVEDGDDLASLPEGYFQDGSTDYWICGQMHGTDRVCFLERGHDRADGIEAT